MSSIRVAGQLNQLTVGAKKKQNQIWVGGQSAGVWGVVGVGQKWIGQVEKLAVLLVESSRVWSEKYWNTFNEKVRQSRVGSQKMGKRGTQLDFVAVAENGENPCPAYGTSTSKKDLKWF